MKIAVTASGASLDAKVDPRFGRCPCFLIIDTDTMEFEAIENPNLALGGGAGIQSSQLMAEKGVSYVLTGNCGPNAYQSLTAAGVGVIVGCSGIVKDAVEQFKMGELNVAGEPTVASHFGMGGGMRAGGGMRTGRGRGMGMGAKFPGSAPTAPQQPTHNLSKENELAMLRQQAEVLSQQARQIQERIRQLEQER